MWMIRPMRRPLSVRIARNGGNATISSTREPRSDGLTPRAMCAAAGPKTSRPWKVSLSGESWKWGLVSRERLLASRKLNEACPVNATLVFLVIERRRKHSVVGTDEYALVCRWRQPATLCTDARVHDDDMYGTAPKVRQNT